VNPAEASLRLDKWLWHARFFPSRTQAADFCAHGRIRISGRIIDRPSAPVKPGDVVTFALGRRVHVLRVVALGERRGPAVVARTLYHELSDDGQRHSL
jgi:ribosome-associated heat shock protein Hsp15